MPDRPWVRIVIVTFNSGEYTQRCLDALAAQTERDFEVVIVDNQSSDGAIEQLVLPDDRFLLKISPENTGFSGGSNLGSHGAKAPYIMTVNPDTLLDPGCLAALLTATQSSPEYVMFSPVLFKSAEKRILDGAGDSLSMFGWGWRNGGDRSFETYQRELSKPSRVFSPTGAAALYQRAAFEREGGFDVTFFCYLEDLDLGLRLRARGESCLLVPDATGIHTGGHSSNTISGFAVRKSVQNNLGLIIKSVPLLLLPFMLSFHFLSYGWFQFRNRGTELAAIRRQGFREGLKSLPSYVAVRTHRRRYPFGASFRIARAISWSVKEAKTRPLRILKHED